MNDPAFHSDWGDKAGSMHDVFPSSQRNGRKIATWKFRPAAPNAIEIEVDVSMIGSKELALCAKSKALPEPLVHTDIEQLRKSVWSALSEQSRMLTGIDWEDWLEIITDGANGTGGANLVVKVNPIKRGVDPETGRVLSVNANGFVVDFPSATKLDGQQSRPLGRLGFITERTPERAYVPDTPEIRAAMDDIFSRMSALRSRLAESLSQEARILHFHARQMPLLDIDGEDKHCA